MQDRRALKCFIVCSGSLWLWKPDSAAFWLSFMGNPFFPAPLGPEVQRPRSCLLATASSRISSGKDLLTCSSPLTQVVTSNLVPLARQPGRDSRQAGPAERERQGPQRVESLLEARAPGGLLVTWETPRWHKRHLKPLIRSLS